MISNTCKTAIKATIYLCSKFDTGENASIKEVAEFINANEHTVGKILQTLVKQNVIKSLKGPTGGFFISKEQQKRRFLKRIEDPSRNWKFSSADVKERHHWESYMQAYSALLSNTSTDLAPWYVIPADNKWFMRYAVSEIVINRLRGLPLSFPNLPQDELNKLDEARLQLENENLSAQAAQ